MTKYEKIECEPQMIVNVKGSIRALEAWQWAVEHKLEFKLLVQYNIGDEDYYLLPIELINTAKEMLTPPFHNTLDYTSHPNLDLDFLFVDCDELMIFKLIWAGKQDER